MILAITATSTSTSTSNFQRTVEYEIPTYQRIIILRSAGQEMAEPESSLSPVGTIPSQTNPIHTLTSYNSDTAQYEWALGSN
jgi:hypothetical protein